MFDDLDPYAATIVAFLSAAAMLPLYLIELSLGDVLGFNIGAIIAALVPLLLVLPLPIAYIDSISRKRFRKETLATLIVVPFATQGPAFTAFALGLIIGGMYVSYRARSIYNGRNRFWTYFKASGGVITILALSIGLMTVGFYNDSPEFQTDVQDGLTGKLSDFAMDYASQISPQQVAADQQAQIRDMAGTLAADISEQTILMTSSQIINATQDDGSFSPQQVQLLGSEFDTARNEIPPELQTRIQDRFDTASETQSNTSIGGQDTIQAAIEPQIENIVQKATEPSDQTSLLLFFTTFSIVILFKLPFEFLGGIYAIIIDGIRNLLERTGTHLGPHGSEQATQEQQSSRRDRSGDG